MTEAATNESKVLAVIVCDFARSAIGTRSRLCDQIAGKPVLQHVLDRLAAVEGIRQIALLAPADQLDQARPFATAPIHLLELAPRSVEIHARVRTGRQWGLCSWRGGAGQYTIFDEEYHPSAIAAAAKEFAAGHVLIVHSHGLLLDPHMTSALIRHHVHKNHEMKMTYTPSAPGLCGMMLRADLVAEMGEKNVLPWQLLAYDPANPTFDTLIREACMQVDPAVSKIPNRFCVDTDRSWAGAQELFASDNVTKRHGGKVDGDPLTLSPSHLVTLSASSLALAAARTVAPGVTDLSRIHPQPRELEIELTGRRMTAPLGAVPALIREARGTLDPAHWIRWFRRHASPAGDLLPDTGSDPLEKRAGNPAPSLADDLLITFAGDGDPLLYPQFADILRAARQAGVLSICLQTDLAVDDLEPLVAAVEENLIDVLSVTMYGHTAETYANVAGADLQATVMKNLQRLAPITTRRGGVPLVIPRLLKVRETIPDMEPFFDAWIKQAGWAVIDFPTDRAGQIPFTGVIDMAPPRRKACRRLWDRLLIRANGTAVACDQDMHDRLTLGHIESATLPDMWASAPFTTLREKHAASLWNNIDPCQSCKEWHRP